MIKLIDKERFLKEYPVSEEKLKTAVARAVSLLKKSSEKYGDSFFESCTVDYKYVPTDKTDWTQGMQAGCFWLGYSLTGENDFLKIAKSMTKRLQARLETKEGLDDHDIGFNYTPSCVAEYVQTGNPAAKEAAIRAGFELLSHFDEKGGYIRRMEYPIFEAYRMIIDTLMNIPLLLWTGKQTGDNKFEEAARRHLENTVNYIVRDDFSTFHHFQFDPESGKPLYGCTWQGYSDESCWSRGHAWGVYGLPLYYSYIQDKNIREAHKNLTFYMLNHLPSNGVPYWDMHFTEPSTEPPDASASAVAVCGLLEMCKYLPENSEEKKIFKNAADLMMNALIDICSTPADDGHDGILFHVTHALPQDRGIDQSAAYGDYFYLEALARYINPDFKRYW